MDEKIMRVASFGAEIDRHKSGVCPFCKKDVKEQYFDREADLKEFRISGLCVSCQKDIFS